MSDVINEVEHKLILQDEEAVLRRAGIAKQFLHNSAIPLIAAADLAWLKNFKQYREDGDTGAVMLGKQKVKPAHKMQAMTGVLLRNYIDSRMITLTRVLELLEAGEHIDCSCLMIPNFFVAMEGKTLPAWQVAKLYDMLLSREAEGLMTVLYVENALRMTQTYGGAMTEYVSDYVKIGD